MGEYRTFGSIEEDFKKYEEESRGKSKKVKDDVSMKCNSVFAKPIKICANMKDKLVIDFMPPDTLHCEKLGPANDVFTYLEAKHPILMKTHYDDLPVQKRHAGMPGCNWNGVQLDKLLTDGNLAKLVSRLPPGSHAEEIAEYLKFSIMLAR